MQVLYNAPVVIQLSRCVLIRALLVSMYDVQPRAPTIARRIDTKVLPRVSPDGQIQRSVHSVCSAAGDRSAFRRCGAYRCHICHHDWARYKAMENCQHRAVPISMS